MYALSIEAPFCAGTNCGWHLSVPAFYFISFFVLTTCTLISLLTAVILDAYQDSQRATQPLTALHAGGAHRLTVNEAELYATLWSEQVCGGM